jgi:tRNA dimethylallyltransferase
MELPKIIAIVGTNASGKSSIGLKLAQRFNGEIISADSRQVYRGFDLCCGKVTAEEMQIVPHHLLDLKTIGESFSVSEYQKMAYFLIPQILGRDKVPFIVGGTGLYISSVVKGYVLNEESVDSELREKLGELPIEELQAMLTPKGRAFLESNQSEVNNKRRIIRVLEKTAKGESLNHENIARYDALQLGITWSKEKLHARIDERLELRIKNGMIDEVKEYLDRGGKQEYLFDLGLEYRYILWYLTGKFQSLDEFKIEMSRAIKRFAKRQKTWFSRDESIHWIDMDADYLDQACLLISNFLRH